MPRPTSRLNADRVETACHPEIIQLGRKTKVIRIIGREAFGTIEECMNTRLSKQRHTVHSFFQNWLKMIKILWQLIKFEILRNAIHRPRFGFRLESTKQNLTGIFFVVRIFIRHPQNGQLRHVGNVFSDNIKVLASMKRHGNARHFANLTPPHATAVHDHVCFDMTRISILSLPIDTGDTLFFFGDASHFNALFNKRAVLTRAFS